MQKIAQQRGILNKLREFTHLPGRAFEGASSEFENIMNDLRDNVDDPIRAIISGEKIGEALPTDEVSLKDVLKSAKAHIGRREYMSAVSELSKFHKRMKDVVDLLKGFSSNIDKTHEKFLFESLDDETKKHLHGLKERLKEQKKASIELSLVKEADIFDFVHNVMTERGRALAAWEKRYPKQIGKLKKDTASTLNASERVLSNALSVLKVLATARATRNPAKYIDAAQKVIKIYEAYDANFREYYKSNVKNFLEKQELISPVVSDKTNEPAEIGKQEVPVEKKRLVEPVPPEPEVREAIIPMLPQVENKAVVPGKRYVAPSVPEAQVSSSVTPAQELVFPAKQPVTKSELFPSLKPGESPVGGAVKKQEIPAHLMHSSKPPGKRGHQQFINSLECLANEDPLILASFIRQYAKSIQATDIATSIKLFKLAQSIKG